MRNIWKNADIKMQNEVENVIRLSSFGAKRHPEGEYMENPEAGASEVPWETGDSAAKPAKKCSHGPGPMFSMSDMTVPVSFCG